MVQLDGLRALAVLGVFVWHTLPVETTTVWEPGRAGVRLFFVLSGFLITGILLRGRAGALKIGQSRKRVIFAFYARRFLRIFPLYYVVLGLALAIGISYAIESAPWHLAYLTNVYAFLIGHHVGPLSHFWSLAVEEQFYLVWPAIVLFAPRRLLRPFFISVIVAAPVFRVVTLRLTFSTYAQYLAPGCLDSLGIGALLAYFWQWQQPNDVRIFCRRCLTAGLVLLVVLKGLQITGYQRQTIHIGLIDSALCLIFVWVVHHAARGFRGPVGALLASPPMVYLGTISYGLYVWHEFAAAFAEQIDLLGWKLNFPYERGLARFAFVTVFSVVAASLSWFAFERPLNDLKRYVPYLRK